MNISGVRDGVVFYSPRYGTELERLFQRSGVDALRLNSLTALGEDLDETSARVLLFDARGAAAEGLNALAAAAPIAESHEMAVLVLLGTRDHALAEDAFRAGATHFLVSPIRDSVLIQTLRYADRYAARLRDLGGAGGSAGQRERRRDELDGLTRLYNQRHLLTQLQALMSGPDCGGLKCALLIVSISRFQQLNRSYGRSSADRLLQLVARRLQRALAEDPVHKLTLGRLGGADFVILMEGPLDIRDTIFLSQQVADLFGKPFLVNERVVHLNCRIGIATCDDRLHEAEALIQRASIAVAEAQASEANSFQVYSHDDSAPHPARVIDLGTDLRRALKRGTLDIHFQPQVEISSNRISGVEALMRWNHPEFGEIGPETILGVAEHAEIGAELGSYLLQRALTEAMGWTDPLLQKLLVSVNITADQLVQEDFLDRVRELLHSTAFPPNRLILELTETNLVENLGVAAKRMGELRLLGISMAIDDFGTGYSSLAYLKSLPLDHLKIDRRFVIDVNRTKRDRVVFHSVVELARSLDMDVIAEGVETESQLSQLIREGCTWYQGFLCSGPLPSAEVSAFVLSWNARKQP